MKGKCKKRMLYEKKINQIKNGIKERTINEAMKVAESVVGALSIKHYPVPIVKILNDIGFAIFATDTEKNISGYILISPDLREKFGTDRIIAVDRLDSYGRQRFTLAHEFAHYLFDFNENSNYNFVNTYDTEKADTEDEMVPSRFAAELLMPPDLFVTRYNELSKMTRYDRVHQLVIDFAVTQTAVVKRIEELKETLEVVQ